MIGFEAESSAMAWTLEKPSEVSITVQTSAPLEPLYFTVNRLFSPSPVPATTTCPSAPTASASTTSLLKPAIVVFVWRQSSLPVAASYLMVRKSRRLPGAGFVVVPATNGLPAASTATQGCSSQSCPGPSARFAHSSVPVVASYLTVRKSGSQLLVVQDSPVTKTALAETARQKAVSSRCEPPSVVRYQRRLPAASYFSTRKS